MKIGELFIDENTGKVLKNGELLSLTATESAIVQYLAKNKNEIITRQQIYENLWQEDSYGCDNSIMVHISHLRDKLESDPRKPRYIRTLKGMGYMMVNPDDCQ